MARLGVVAKHAKQIKCVMGGKPLQKTMLYKVVPPQLCLLVYNLHEYYRYNPLINPSYSTYVHQLNANDLGHHLVSAPAGGRKVSHQSSQLDANSSLIGKLLLPQP